MLRYGFVPYRRDGQSLVIVVSDPTDLPMIDELAVLLATPIKVTVGHPLGHPVDSEEERELAARARGGDRELPAPDPARGRRWRRPADGRQADGRLEPGHPAGRHDDLHRHPAARQRHPHRDAGRCGPREVPDRRRAAAGDAADRQAASTARSSRASRSWRSSTSPRSACRRTAASSCACRGKTIDFRVSIMPSVHGEDAVIRILDKESISEQFHELRLDILGFPGRRAAAVPQVHRRALRHGARHRPDRQRQDDDALRARCRRSSRSRTRSSPSRIRSSTSCAASRRSRSTRRRG